MEKIDQNAQTGQRVRYSDAELAEFKEIIEEKLAKAKSEYNTLRQVVMHNGTNDIEIYTDSNSNSAATAKKLNDEIFLKDGDSGLVWLHKTIVRNWDENKDYLYPIPTDERNLTHGKLAQNPGWDDGLTF